MEKYVILLIAMVMIVRKGTGQRKGQCQEITIPMCKEIAYNYTYMPNEVRPR